MPGFDRTGPMGMGPMTGRGAGYCAVDVTPGRIQRFFGRGLGLGRGFRGGGRGWRRMFYATGLPFWARGPYTDPTPSEDVSTLKAEADWLKGQLDDVNRRLQELEKS